MEPFSREARASIVCAREEAKALGSNSIGAEHLLMGLAALRGSQVSELLEKSGVSLEAMRTIVEELTPHSTYERQGMIFTKSAKRIIQEAFKISRRYQ